MTISYLSGTVLFLATWIVYAWIRNEVSWMILRRFGRKNGCEEPKLMKNEYPGGLERYVRMLKFKKGMDILEDHVRARYLDMGVGTYRVFNPLYQTTALQSIDSGNTKELQADEKFVEAMSFSQDYIIFRLRFFKLWWLARSRKFLDACQTCKDYSANFVQIALNSTSKSKHSSSSSSDSKSESEKKEKYILLNALTEQTRDPIELRDQMLHLLLAGRDTTASLLAWTLLLLSRSPSRYTKYRSIILSHFGPLSSSSPLTFTSLKACKPLTHLLHETLRLYPLVPMNSRVAVRDTILPVGGGRDGRSPLAVRKGETVNYSSYVMHRREDIWGGDVLEWKPERWEGRKLGWEFGGFSGGNRVCIGQQYALNEASFVIARFLQKYERIEAVDLSGKDGLLGKKLSLIMSPTDVRVRLYAAAE